MVYNGLVLGLAVVLIGLASFGEAQLSGFYSAKEVSARQHSAINVLATSKSLQDIYNAFSYLKSSGHAHYDIKCDNIHELLSKATNAYDLYFGLNIGNSAKCSFKSDAGFVSLARKELQVCGDYGSGLSVSRTYLHHLD